MEEPGDNDKYVREEQWNGINISIYKSNALTDLFEIERKKDSVLLHLQVIRIQVKVQFLMYLQVFTNIQVTGGKTVVTARDSSITIRRILFL